MNWEDRSEVQMLHEMDQALRPFAELGVDLTHAACHEGLCSPEECGRCSKVLAARKALRGMYEHFDKPFHMGDVVTEAFLHYCAGCQGSHHLFAWDINRLFFYAGKSVENPLWFSTYSISRCIEAYHTRRGAVCQK